MSDKFRKKLVVIEAMQLLWTNWNEMCDFLGGPGGLEKGKPIGCFVGPDGRNLPEGQTSQEIGLLIPALEGLMIGRQNDWIIKGIKGEIYPCKPDIFAATYEAIDE